MSDLNALGQDTYTLRDMVSVIDTDDLKVLAGALMKVWNCEVAVSQNSQTLATAFETLKKEGDLDPEYLDGMIVSLGSGIAGLEQLVLKIERGIADSLESGTFWSGLGVVLDELYRRGVSVQVKMIGDKRKNQSDVVVAGQVVDNEQGRFEMDLIGYSYNVLLATARDDVATVAQKVKEKAESGTVNGLGQAGVGIFARLFRALRKAFQLFIDLLVPGFMNRAVVYNYVGGFKANLKSIRGGVRSLSKTGKGGASGRRNVRRLKRLIASIDDGYDDALDSVEGIANSTARSKAKKALNSIQTGQGPNVKGLAKKIDAARDVSDYQDIMNQVSNQIKAVDRSLDEIKGIIPKAIQVEPKWGRIIVASVVAVYGVPWIPGIGKTILLNASVALGFAEAVDATRKGVDSVRALFGGGDGSGGGGSPLLAMGGVIAIMWVIDRIRKGGGFLPASGSDRKKSQKSGDASTSDSDGTCPPGWETPTKRGRRPAIYQHKETGEYIFSSSGVMDKGYQPNEVERVKDNGRKITAEDCDWLAKNAPELRSDYNEWARGD